MLTTSKQTLKYDRQVALWLLSVAVLIFCMVLLGGVTRLTHSGLSMVEWKPIVGTLPPIGEQAWQDTFEKYKAFPEYQKTNLGMNLSEFKSIFWFEYSHRVLGRAIGLAFLIPFLIFWFQGKLHRRQIPTYISMFILGGLQGVLGWYMVKSGLVNDPNVSQYRLTAHLLAAISIYIFILWVAFSLLHKPAAHGVATQISSLRKHGFFVTGLILLMIISGGFVAGTKAGFVFNTFPLMDGQWLPPGGMALNPWWLNLLENLATIQFTHRVIAIVVTIAVLSFVIRGWRTKMLDPATRSAFNLLFVMLLIQIGLGISTLLFVVPVKLAAAHQAGALLLLTSAWIINHRLRKSATSDYL